MKKIIIWIALLSFVNATSQEKILTLNKAIQYALENKSDAEKARLEIEKSEYKIKEVRANAYPNLSLNGGLNYNPLLQETVLPGIMFGQPGVDVRVSFGQKWTSNATATLTQVLFNQSVFTGLKAAKSTKEFYMLNKELTEEQIIEKVAKAYFQVYQAEQQLQNIESNLQLTEQTVKVIQGQYDAGLARKIDLDRASVSINNLKSTRQQVINSVDLAKNALKFMIGMPMENEITLPKDTFEPIILSGAAENNVEDRTEIKVYRKQIELLNWKKKASEAEYYPSLSLFATYGYLGQGKKIPLWNGEQEGVYWSDMSSIGLKLNVPIFSGFGIKSRVKQNEIEIKEAEVELQNTKLALEMAYKNAQAQMNNSMIMIETQKSNVKLAEDVLSNTQNNYKYGLATLTDLLDSERALSDAKNNLTNAKLNYKFAEVEYLKANGKLDTLKK